MHEPYILLFSVYIPRTSYHKNVLQNSRFNSFTISYQAHSGNIDLLI